MSAFTRTLDTCPNVTPGTADHYRTQLSDLSSIDVHPRHATWGEAPNGRRSFIDNLTAGDYTLAGRVYRAAVIMNEVFDAHTVALSLVQPVTLTATVNDGTRNDGLASLGDRQGQARAILAMREREATAQAEVEKMRAELVEARRLADVLRDEASRLKFAQITDGGDSRLVEFWEIAESNANEAGFCSEYDRMADMMNGTGRNRDWSVSGTITVTIPFSVGVSARSEQDARDEVDGRSFSEWVDTIREASSWNGELDSVDIGDVETD